MGMGFETNLFRYSVELNRFLYLFYITTIIGVLNMIIFKKSLKNVFGRMSYYVQLCNVSLQLC